MDGWTDGLILCRLCLCRSECFVDIFGENVDLEFNVAKTIHDLLQFQVTRVEGIPSLACATCVKELNHFRIFKSRCVDSKVTFDRRFTIRQREADISGRNEDAVESVVYGNGISRAGDSSSCVVGGEDEQCNGIAKVKDEEKTIQEEDTGIPLCIVKVESVASNHKLGYDHTGAVLSEGGSVCGGWGVEGGGDGRELGEREMEEDDDRGVQSAVVVKSECLEQDVLPSCGDYVDQELSTSEDDVRQGGDNAVGEGWTASAQGEETVALGARHTSRVAGDDGRTSFVVVKTESLAECAVDVPKLLEKGGKNPSDSKMPPIDPSQRRLIERHFVEKIPPTGKKSRPQRRCQVCSARGKRRDTVYWCPECNAGLCLEDCFKSPDRGKAHGTVGRFNQKGSKYTERFKRIVVQYAESTSAQQTSEHFDIPGRSVRRWKLQSRKWKKSSLGKIGPAG